MNKEYKKTVFIVIGRGFIARNILRSGILDHLKKGNARIVLFFLDNRKVGLPQYLRDEFEDEQVTIESVIPPAKTWLRRKFTWFAALFVYNEENKDLYYTIVGKNNTRFFIEKVLSRIFRTMPSLKKIIRYLEKKVFSSRSYGHYFDKYKPDVVFSTSIIASIDSDFLNEALRKKIKTVGMPRGWDNVTTNLYKAVPNILVVQNSVMKDDAVVSQGIKSENILVSGFPQSDWYKRKDIIQSREEYFNSIGLDPKRKLILWGSSWTPGDKDTCQSVIDAVNKDGILSKPSSLLIRSHFTDMKNDKFSALKDIENVKIDDNFTPSGFFWDNYDPSVKETKKFVNMLYHADVVITLCSTLSLDALSFGSPIINIAFGTFYDKDGNDASATLYNHKHYMPLIDQKAVSLVYSENELIKNINHFLLHPEKGASSRRKVLDMLCYKVDGNSSKRIADAILSD